MKKILKDLQEYENRHALISPYLIIYGDGSGRLIINHYQPYDSLPVFEFINIKELKVLLKK